MILKDMSLSMQYDEALASFSPNSAKGLFYFAILSSFIHLHLRSFIVIQNVLQVSIGKSDVKCITMNKMSLQKPIQIYRHDDFTCQKK